MEHARAGNQLHCNAEPLEFALDLIRPRIATCGLPRIPGLISAVIIHARLLALAHCAPFASKLEPRRVQPRDTVARFGALTSHIKAPADASARGGGRAWTELRLGIRLRYHRLGRACPEETRTPREGATFFFFLLVARVSSFSARLVPDAKFDREPAAQRRPSAPARPPSPARPRPPIATAHMPPCARCNLPIALLSLPSLPHPRCTRIPVFTLRTSSASASRASSPARTGSATHMRAA